jgi:hypothetical protein
MGQKNVLCRPKFGFSADACLHIVEELHGICILVAPSVQTKDGEKIKLLIIYFQCFLLTDKARLYYSQINFRQKSE